MIRLYMDENAHGAVTRGLHLRGVDVLTVQEDGRERLPDPEVLDRAEVLGRVLFSQDVDLLREATLRQRAGRSFAGVIFAQQRRVSIRQCLDDLEVLAKASEPNEFLNTILYIPI